MALAGKYQNKFIIKKVLSFGTTSSNAKLEYFSLQESATDFIPKKGRDKWKRFKSA